MSSAWRAGRAFSPREAWKIEIDLDSDRVRSKKQRALPSLPGGLDPEFAPPLGGGMRLGGQQLRVQVSGFAAVSRRPAQNCLYTSDGAWV